MEVLSNIVSFRKIRELSVYTILGRNFSSLTEINPDLMNEMICKSKTFLHIMEVF